MMSMRQRKRHFMRRFIFLPEFHSYPYAFPIKVWLGWEKFAKRKKGHPFKQRLLPPRPLF